MRVAPEVQAPGFGAFAASGSPVFVGFVGGILAEARSPLGRVVEREFRQLVVVLGARGCWCFGLDDVVSFSFVAGSGIASA